MIYINMIYNTNNPGTVDAYSLYLSLDKVLDVRMPDGSNGKGKLLDVEPTDIEGVFQLTFEFDNSYGQFFLEVIDRDTYSMN